MSREVKLDTVKVRIFIEGVLFPFATDVTVSEYEGSVRATMQMPPSPSLNPEVLVGAMVHIFYANERVLRNRGGSDVGPPIGKGWPILFQGEVSGHSRSKTVQSENLVLHLVSHTRHFDQTLLYFFDKDKANQTALSVNLQKTFIGNTTIELEAGGVLSKSSQILNILTDRVNALDTNDSARNIAYTSMVLDLMRSARQRHALFAYFDNKLKLSQRFAAYPDPDVKLILKATQLKNVIDQKVERLPPYTPLTKILRVCTDVTQYNWNQLAQPKLRTFGSDTTNPEQKQKTNARFKISAFVKLLEGADRTKGQQTFVSTDLGGTITLPAELLSSTNFKSKAEIERGIFEQFKKEEGTDTNARVKKAIKKYMAENNYPVPALKKKSPEKTGPGDAEEVISAESEEVNVPEALLEEQAQLELRDELNEYILTPNMRFMQPPKCNVFAPFDYTSFNMTRNELKEITRLFAHVNVGPATGAEAIEWYLAPMTQAYHKLEGSSINAYTQQLQEIIKKNNEVIKNVQE